MSKDCCNQSVYRGGNKGLFILLSRTQAGPGRTVKHEQEEISRNHVQTFSGCSIYKTCNTIHLSISMGLYLSLLIYCFFCCFFFFFSLFFSPLKPLLAALEGRERERERAEKDTGKQCSTTEERTKCNKRKQE